jgi:type IV pilus assembly protein PilO
MSLRDAKTQRLVITVALCGAAGWAYFLSDLLPFGYQVQARKTKELRTQHEAVSTELEKARRTVSNLPQLEKEQQELERKWNQAETLLPSDKEMAQLLTQITQAGEQAGVTFQNFKPDAQKPQEFYNENPVEIEVKGGFHQVGVFLSRLANLSRIVNVTDLQLAGSTQKSRGKDRKAREEAKAANPDERSDQTLVASFTATAYSLRDPSAPAPQAPAAEPGAHRTIKSAAVNGGAKSTPGALTKRLGDKAKQQPTEGETK